MTTRKGFFVQVWKPSVPRAFGRPDYVTVAGRSTSRGLVGASRWTGVSRELSRRKAIRFAREYNRAGFITRVVFRGFDRETVVVQVFNKKRNTK